MDNNLLCKLINFINQEKKSCIKLDQQIVDIKKFQLNCKLENDKQLKDLHTSFNNEPNFIILVSGQSNAGGWGSSYDVNNINDQPNENIFGYDIKNSIWKKADLRDTSLGPVFGRAPGTNLFAFHFAKHLIEKFPNMKPGIINICAGGKPIADWALFDKNEKYYEYNKKNAKLYDNLEQGHFFNIHKDVYYKALSQILNCSIKIDVVLWHQGETDNLINSDLNYYNISLLKVIEQYTKLNNNLPTPFIAGTILDYFESNSNSDNINNIIRNIKKDGYNYAELSKLDRVDAFHFTSESHRLMGKLYYDSYINMSMKK